MTAKFTPTAPTPWKGRYARIPGERSVFHLKWVRSRWWPVIEWDTEEGDGTCHAVDCDAARGLADAVSRAKTAAGGSGAGSFVINEYGQVLVPSSDGCGRRYLAGKMEGMILFENPFCPERPINLAAKDNLRNGQEWKLPYVGVPYNLHRNGSVYFYQLDEDGGRSVRPPKQDAALIQSLRNIRPRGPARFIVNPAGLVLTRRPVDINTDEESWPPVFVGSISTNLWFEKE